MNLFSHTLTSCDWILRQVGESDCISAEVPGCVHTDLLKNERIGDPFYGDNELNLQWIEEHDWEYQTQFDLCEDDMQAEFIQLCADGLDTVATVWLNDHEVGRSENMYIAHRWDVKKHLHVGKNQLLIRFYSALEYIRTHRTDFVPPKDHLDPVGNSVRIRKQPSQFGWDWGPRLVTAGIWRDIRLEGWDEARLDRFNVDQHHADDGGVTLSVDPKFLGEWQGVQYKVEVSLGDEVVCAAEAEAGDQAELKIDQPCLWWPAGQGGQPLYQVRVSVHGGAGEFVGELTKRIGLRTIRLDQSDDQWGRAFQFVVNGRSVFMKGANWIPADSFVTRLSRENYQRDLEAAVQANMNCIRVWGGGIYEDESFYDLCDELGLVVWQDFMFSCILVPGDDSFLQSVEVEATQQVQRLRDRACLGLWCGNNELPQLNQCFFAERPELKHDYEKLFHHLLPNIIEQYGASTDYWPSSEWRGVFESGHELGEKSGDTHFWDVWHAGHPVKDYEKWHFRFCSEFGMQSYSSPETNATFAPEGANIFGPIMENHQKNTAGNQVILDYVSRRYRFPKSQDYLIWLSQLNQAYCMQVGVEHYRRSMPRCMGALYWQLNDCWPAASWSSIEYTGRWKALHYAARRFFAPTLASAYVPGDEIIGKGNYRHSTVREVNLYTVYDGVEPMDARLEWQLMHLNGQMLLADSKDVELRNGESVQHQQLDLADALSEHGRENLYIRVALESACELLSEQDVLLTPPRFIDLPNGEVSAEISKEGQGVFSIVFHTDVYLHAFTFNLRGLSFAASDNVFPLFPGRPKEVQLLLPNGIDLNQVRKSLKHWSLVDSYS